MPGGDGTGPQGMGPMTGRAAGLCAGNPTPGYANPAPGMGLGRGRGGLGRGGGWGRGGMRGGGRGWGGGYYPAIPAVPVQYAPGQVPVAPPAPYGAASAPAMTRDEQLDDLRMRAEQFENALRNIRAQIDALQGANE